MAHTVNARDLILQAAPIRVLPVGLPPNVLVPTGQVEGLEALSSSSKVIFLKATSQAFQIPKSGAAASPASIDLSVVLRNITGTVVWTVTSGNATLTGTGANRTLAYASMNSDTVTIKVEVTEGSTTYSDSVTVVKLREGSDTINAFLSNESHSIPADSNGNYTTLSGASTSMNIFIGLNETSGSWTFSRSSSTGVTTSISGNTVTVTDMTAAQSSGYVDITATRSGYPTLTRRMSLVKIRAGQNGSSVTGPRGSGHYYAVGSSWSDSTANAACPSGFPVTNDVVTISNGSNFVMEKKWNGSSWAPTGVVLDGSLLVPNSVTAAAINTNNLAIRDANGNVILGSGVKLPYATWISGAPTSLSGINSSEGSKLFSIESGATVGATFGVNIGGQITTLNASTYIAAAAISDALIGNLAAGKITAGTMTGHNIRTKESGQRLELNKDNSNALQAYNDSNAIQATLGAGNSFIPVIWASDGSGTYWAAIEATGTNALRVNGRISTTAKTGGLGTAAMNSVVPLTDNTYDCGSSGFAWANVYVKNPVNVTSDVRAKEGIQELHLGMNLLEKLLPVSYRMRVGQNVVKESENFEGPLLPNQTRPTYLEPRPGVRRHYGLLAQDVKAALDELGIEDSALWCLADKDDPNSAQSLRYGELIPVLINALKETSSELRDAVARIEQLEQTLATKH